MVLPDSHRISRVPRYLGIRPKEFAIVSPTGLSPSVASLSRTVWLRCEFVTPRQHRTAVRSNPATPAAQRMQALTYNRFRLSPFRSPLLRRSLLLSFPGATEMFQFAPLASPELCIHSGMTRHYPRRVSPFGHPRIKGYLHLPEAYRSLSRPSSPSRA